MSLSAHERGCFIKDSKKVPIEPVDFVVDATSKEKYRDLMVSQYLAFMAVYSGDQDTHSEGILHGFITISQIYSQIPEAYSSFLQAEEGTPNYTELQAALVDSFEKVILPLANTDNRRNKTLETWLIGNPIGNGPSYEFRRYGSLVLVPKLDNHLGAAREIMEREDRGDLAEENPRKKCPALAFVLPKLWTVMVRNCIERPDLFQHDINAILTESQLVEV